MIAGEFKVFGEGYIYHVLNSQKREKAPVAYCRANPVPVPGSSYVLARKAPHPNAARLFLEWFLSPQGLSTIEKEMGKSAIFPGSGTQQAKILEGMDLIYQTEELVLKAAELGLIEKFAQILGVKPE